jgi:fibronectin type 3 domain-containing protein
VEYYIKAVDAVGNAAYKGTDQKPNVIVATHEFGTWTCEDETNHKRSCACGEIERQAHEWDEGVVTTQPSEDAEGVKTFTCSVCQGTKTEKVDKLPVTKLGIPTIKVTNRASDGKPYITWTAVDGATGYEVWRCGTSKGTYTKLYTAAANRLYVTHTGAAVGNDYFYKVRAIKGDKQGEFSGYKGVWVDLKQPTIKVLNSISTGKPVIQWEKVDYATGYKVYMSETSGGTYKLIYSTTNPDKLSVTHTGAKAENDYFYKVVAVHKNSKCTSAMSAAKGVWCDLARPTMSVSLNAKNKPYLTWSEIAGADKYEVYVSTNGGAYRLLYTASATKLNVAHSGAVAGNTYSYKVRPVSTVNSKANGSYSVVQTIFVP